MVPLTLRVTSRELGHLNKENTLVRCGQEGLCLMDGDLSFLSLLFFMGETVRGQGTCASLPCFG